MRKNENGRNPHIKTALNQICIHFKKQNDKNGKYTAFQPRKTLRKTTKTASPHFSAAVCAATPSHRKKQRLTASSCLTLLYGSEFCIIARVPRRTAFMLIQRIPTGIPKFDELIEGGFPVNKRIDRHPHHDPSFVQVPKEGELRINIDHRSALGFILHR